MKITASKNVVNIECGAFEYSNIRNLYADGDGFSFQHDELQQKVKTEVVLMCKIITDLVYRLVDLNEKAKG